MNEMLKLTNSQSLQLPLVLTTGCEIFHNFLSKTQASGGLPRQLFAGA